MTVLRPFDTFPELINIDSANGSLDEAEGTRFNRTDSAGQSFHPLNCQRTHGLRVCDGLLASDTMWQWSLAEES